MCGSYNADVMNSDHVASNGWWLLNNEFEGYRQTGRMTEESGFGLCQGKGIFHFPQPSDWIWGQPTFCSVVTGDSFPGSKAGWGWSWPFNWIYCKVKYVWIYTSSSPYIFRAWWFIKYGPKFVFYLLRFPNTEDLTYVRLEIFTAVIMKSSISWDITPCSPLKVCRRFGRTCRLHLQGRRMSRARNQSESRALLIF
jgi:hypothetical protein